MLLVLNLDSTEMKYLSDPRREGGFLFLSCLGTPFSLFQSVIDFILRWKENLPDRFLPENVAESAPQGLQGTLQRRAHRCLHR